MLITVQHQVVHVFDAESMAALNAVVATNGESQALLVETLAGIRTLQRKLDLIIAKQGEQMTQAEGAALAAAVAEVKKDSDEMAVRVDAIIAGLGNSSDPIAIKAAADLGAVSAGLKGYHATPPVVVEPPVTP